MRLHWSREASDDFVDVIAYLDSRSRLASRHVARSILKRATGLLTFPRSGRPGERPGTRELILNPLPYILVYRIDDDVLEIVGLLHGAQDRPETH